MPFVQCDSSAIEAVMVGYYMGGREGRDYVDLAKRGAHDWLVCKWLGWEFTPENKKRVKNEHGELRERMKRVGHGTNFGMRPYLMHINDPEAFPTLKSAKDTQEFLFTSIPRLRSFQRECRERAQKEGYLTNAWGLRHYFYDVFTYQLDDDGKLVLDQRGDPKIKHGKDSNRAIAFLPQSSAGMFARDNLLLLAVSPIEAPAPFTDVEQVMREWDVLQKAVKAGETWQRYMPANVSVHDSYCLDTPEELVEPAIEAMRQVLTRRVPELGGLTVGAACEVGDNWLEMEEVASWPMLEELPLAA
jgi:hypothetical protein